MTHQDSLGNQDTISSGEVQWMTAGSGIIHAESLPASKKMLGVQLWLNLPAKDKMCPPAYQAIKNEDIQEIEISGGKIRLLAGTYLEYQGYQSKYLPLDYYDVHLNENGVVRIETPKDNSVMLFTLVGEVVVAGEKINEKTAVKLTSGEYVEIKTESLNSQVLFISSRPLNEPVFWGGPIVMSSQEDLYQAFIDLENAEFIQSKIEYEEEK